MLINLSNKNSIINKYVAELRDIKLQTDRMRFRTNIERITAFMAYEISKKLSYHQQTIQTPLSEAKGHYCSDKIVVASILRAGIAMHNALLDIFDEAENGFISAYRKYNDDDSFDIKFDYLSAPDINNKVVLLADPMLATGASMFTAYESLLEKGDPKHVHFISIIGSNEGVEFLKNHVEEHKSTIWLAALDDELTAKGYIVPGLGDAGDLAYGEKEDD